MKILFIFVSIFWNSSLFSYQPCQQVEFENKPDEFALLKQYIISCREKRYFFDDKGVVKLITYKNSKGLVCWRLSAIIDDKYLASPPEQYAFINNDAVLVYSGDSTGHVLTISSDLRTRSACIQEIVSTRLYNHVTGSQFVYSRDSKGVMQKIPVTYFSVGNSHNDIIIRFNTDNTITRFKPV